MQHDHNIEDILRQMEAVEQPDLSQMDKHWQQMQAILQPGSVPVKKGWPKWMLNMLSVITVVIFVAAAIWFTASKKNNQEENTSIQKQETKERPDVNAISEAPAAFVSGSIATIATALPSRQPAINPSLIDGIVEKNSNGKWTGLDSILATMKINFTDCGNCPSKNNTVALSDAERRRWQLRKLFMQLGKEEQHFLIDNSRDTLLRFEEGTVLLAPANSLGGMNGVEITAKEFYKTSDIILNQLTTMSSKDQLESGGMVYLKANYKGNEVTVSKQNPLILVLPDTSKNIAGMQLFTGDSTGNDGKINWNPQQQFFSKSRLVTQARVLNLVNEPYKIKNIKKGDIAYFILGDDETIDKEKIRQKLKEKYNYYKVKLRPNFYKAFHTTYHNDISSFSRYIGDSVWMDIARAKKYNLDILATRQFYVAGNGLSNYYNLSDTSKELFQQVLNKYSVSLSGTGWINCDRFYAYSGKRVDFAVNLGDSAHNYYSVLLFDNIRSLMNGYLSGNNVVFSNIPAGLPVKVITIGINKKGETVYSVTHTTTSGEELKGVQFQNTSAPGLRTVLSKYDQ